MATHNQSDWTTLDCPSFTQADSFFLVKFSFWVEGVAQTSIATLGIFGNLISCLILTRKHMRNSFNLLLVTLAAYDTWYLFGAILESFRKSFNLASDLHILMFPYFLYPLHQTSMTGSIFMTVAIAFERYSAVHFPINYSQVRTKGTTFLTGSVLRKHSLHLKWNHCKHGMQFRLRNLNEAN